MRNVIDIFNNKTTDRMAREYDEVLIENFIKYCENKLTEERMTLDIIDYYRTPSKRL